MDEEAPAWEAEAGEVWAEYPNLEGIALEEQRRATIGFALIAAQVPVKPLADFAAMVNGLAKLFESGVLPEAEPPRGPNLLARVK
jgi:hypothetical protein